MPTKRKRAQTIGMVNHLAQSAIDLLPIISPLRPELSAIPNWTDERALSFTEVHQFEALKVALQNLRGGKYLTKAAIVQIIYSSKEFTGVQIDGKTFWPQLMQGMTIPTFRISLPVVTRRSTLASLHLPSRDVRKAVIAIVHHHRKCRLVFPRHTFLSQFQLTLGSGASGSTGRSGGRPPPVPPERPAGRRPDTYPRARHPRVNELEELLENAVRVSRSSIKNDEVLDILRFNLPPLTPTPSTAAASNQPMNDTEDEIYPLEDCSFTFSSITIENDKGRPYRTIYLPRNEQSVNFLLDSGANVNVLNLLTCIRLRIPIRRDPIGFIGGIGGKSPVYGKVHAYFYILSNSPNLLSWSLINKIQYVRAYVHSWPP